MDRILLLMDHKQNRRLVKEWLEKTYDVVPGQTDADLDDSLVPKLQLGDATWRRSSASPEANRAACGRRPSGRLDCPAVAQAFQPVRNKTAGGDARPTN